MLLENLAFPEVDAYLKEKDAILIPVGSVEQHSPCGLIGTDFIRSRMHRPGNRQTHGDNGCANTGLWYFSPPHGFSGSATLTLKTLIRSKRDKTRFRCAIRCEQYGFFS
jgi:creatinine amidohydrolase